MAYQSRKRNFKSRRERYQRDRRVAGVIFLFLLVWGLIWLGFNWRLVYDVVRTYFH